MKTGAWDWHQLRYKHWNINDKDFIYISIERFRLNWKALLKEYKNPIQNRHGE